MYTCIHTYNLYIYIQIYKLCVRARNRVCVCRTRLGEYTYTECTCCLLLRACTKTTITKAIRSPVQCAFSACLPFRACGRERREKATTRARARKFSQNKTPKTMKRTRLRSTGYMLNRPSQKSGFLVQLHICCSQAPSPAPVAVQRKKWPKSAPGPFGNSTRLRNYLDSVGSDP